MEIFYIKNERFILCCSLIEKVSDFWLEVVKRHIYLCFLANPFKVTVITLFKMYVSQSKGNGWGQVTVGECWRDLKAMFFFFFKLKSFFFFKHLY